MYELFFVRPDAVKALDNPLIKKVLPRYVDVVNDKKISNFQIIKKIEYKPKKNSDIKDLWLTHSKLMKKFEKLKIELDKKSLDMEKLKNPEFSFLDLKIKITEEIMKSCELCENLCKVNRMKGKLGKCKIGKGCQISSEFLHLGEEPHVTPSHTIFFMGCTLECQFCQNWSISQCFEDGYIATPEELAIRIERRRKEGSRNLNLVGGEPTPSLLCILKILKSINVNIPIIWNSNFYMTEKSMKILDGIIDMHLSDFKYGNNNCGLRLSKVKKYFDIVSRNHLIASKKTKITIRHLVLPNHVECCTKPFLKWISENIKDKVIVNIMDQFRPEYKANEYPEINRRLSKDEFNEAIEYAKKIKINFIT
jgi:putative pyruvate formate lyase activating enzyme